MKPIILFDIDSTLLNNAQIHALTFRHLLSKIEGLSWRETLPDRQALGYLLFGKPEGFLESREAGRSFLSPDYYRDSLFEDAIPTLKKLQGKADLGIFSQGPRRLQRAKLKQSGIEKYFDPELVFIFPPRKISKARQVIARLPKTKIYFVDDRSSIAKELINHRAQAFLIRRSNPSGSQEVPE
ncbi:MAG: HAD family hydrolase, partial [Patescibacteria group bacterium]